MNSHRCTHTDAHTHRYTHRRTHTDAHTHRYTHRRTHTDTHTDALTQTHTHMNSHRHTHTDALTQTHTQTDTHTDAHTQTHTQTHSLHPFCLHLSQHCRATEVMKGLYAQSWNYTLLCKKKQTLDQIVSRKMYPQCIKQWHFKRTPHIK